ncbi:RNA polymerase sigma factor [Pseudomonas sp. B22129]|uniref:RNA polymerase sigma factor n=1 Tax=Pseudomonas sp. B22129 TaxID=3235111 RepID=UPI003782F58B
MLARQQGESRELVGAEAHLLGRLMRGDQAAYSEMVSSYQGAMRAVASAIAGHRHVDDVVQDAWLAVVRGLSGFQGRSSLKTWVLTITANQAKGRYGRSRRDGVLEGRSDDGCFCTVTGQWLSAPSGWHEDTPEALLSENELRECIEYALEELSELQSGVLLLRERVGLELEEVAELLGVSLCNARVLLHRARIRVFAAIDRYQACGNY